MTPIGFAPAWHPMQEPLGYATGYAVLRACVTGRQTSPQLLIDGTRKILRP
jgi:hypothetical protein